MSTTTGVQAVRQFDDGIAICGDSTDAEVRELVSAICGPLVLVVTDPPYGNLLEADWDKWGGDQRSFADQMLRWSADLAAMSVPGAAFYVWGGYGVPGFRPFFEYAARLEWETPWRISNLLTWGKKRAYGVQHNYLACREDMLFCILGEPKKSRVFNVPYLDQKRGYEGYNPDYPAKSEYLRRTNVWTDVTEILQGKVHPAQKPLRVIEVPIEASSAPGEWVYDPFAGSMTTAWAARKTGRRWVCVERNPVIWDAACEALEFGERKR
jgi:DNA modification methylase